MYKNCVNDYVGICAFIVSICVLFFILHLSYYKINPLHTKNDTFFRLIKKTMLNFYGNMSTLLRSNFITLDKARIFIGSIPSKLLRLKTKSFNLFHRHLHTITRIFGFYAFVEDISRAHYYGIRIHLERL